MKLRFLLISDFYVQHLIQICINRLKYRNTFMKKILFIVVLFFAMYDVSAQKFRLNGYLMHAFDDRVDSYNDPNEFYRGKIMRSAMWGISGEWMRQPNLGLEIQYLNQRTTAPLTFFNNGVRSSEFQLQVNHFLIGTNKYFRTEKSPVEFFGGLSAGFSLIDLYNPDTRNTTNRTKFSWLIKGGANFWISSQLAIKTQVQLLSVVQSVGGGFFFGTGGSGAAVSPYSSIYQFGLGGGLVYQFKNKK